MFFLGLLLSILIGAALGAIGSGGSILALPVLVYALDVPPATAVPMSLVLVGVTSLGASVMRWRQGDLHWKALILLSSTGAVGAFLGSAATHEVSGNALMIVFASILLIVGTAMFRARRASEEGRQCSAVRCLSAGAVIGLLTGFLGVGGGFLLVPALVIFAGLEMRRALGTSVAIISVNAVAGTLGQLRFLNLDWGLTAWLVLATLAGMGFGVYVANRLPELALRRMLALVMVIVGMGVLAAQVGGFR